ncbi:peptide deformylase [soil metagenome]
MPKHLPALTIAPPDRTAPSGTYRRVPLRRVLARPDPLLARRSREIDPRAPGVLQLAEELVTTMGASPACVGLAAPQIGESVRMFCLDVTGHRKARSCAGLVVMVNPRVVERSGFVVMREGCMSVPDLTGDVGRPAEIVVEGFEPGTSRRFRIAANAMEARCFLHEIDHLDGFVFVDRVSDPSKGLFPRKTYA